MMRTRWLAAWAVLFSAGAGGAQPLVYSAFETAQPPAELPLIPVPGPDAPPAPFAPGGPIPGYDHGHLYLPEPGPQFDRQPTILDELWRVSFSAELAWLTTTGIPRTFRLTPPDVYGRTLPGLIVPTPGGTEEFQGGFGITLGRRLGERGDLEASVFALPGSTTRLEGFAPGTLVYSPDWSRDAPVLVRLPTGLNALGSAFPAALSTTFVGGDVNYRHSLVKRQTVRVDVLAGYRFAYLSDELYIGDGSADGNDAYRQNRLHADSTFHGGQVGVAVGLDRGAWYTDGVVKIAYGAVTTDTGAGGAFGFSRPRPRVGGETRAAVLPTVSGRLGYRLSDRAGVFASYSFQYLDRVARLGDAFCACGGHSDLWVNSLGLGLEWRF